MDVGGGYLDQLTDDDLRILAALAGRGRGRGRAGLVSISPFFAFLVAVEQAARDLAEAPDVAERSVPHRRPAFRPRRGSVVRPAGLA